MSNETLERSEVVAEALAEKYGMPVTHDDLVARLKLAHTLGRTDAFAEAVSLIVADPLRAALDPRDHT